jgi:ABC-2 type transport system ATP-binding protein
MLKVDHVTKRYGDFVAVDRVSFELKPGEIVGFLGPNGSGKTTLMRVMTTYFLPSDGTVYIDGIDVTKDPLEARRQNS